MTPRNPVARRMLVRALALAVVLVSGPALVAQRVSADFPIKGRKAAIEYGVVNYGKHSLEELKPGGDWRMGRNEASVFLTEVPIVAGEDVVAPGSYRVKVQRKSDKEFGLMLEGSEMGISKDGSGGSVVVPGELKSNENPPAKQLEVLVKPSKKSEGAGNEFDVTVRFGPNALRAAMKALSQAKTHKNGSWTVDAFALPWDLAEKRSKAGRATPIATLKRPDPNDTKDTLAFNLLFQGDELSLIPQMQAPTESFGFGDVKPPEKGRIQTGQIQWAEGAGKSDTITVTKVEAQKGKGLLVELDAGGRKGSATIADPTAVAKR